MSNGDTTNTYNGNLTGLPTWARVLGLLGVPSAIAVYLVYSLANFATVGVSDLNRKMDAHAAVMVNHDVAAMRSSEAMTRILLRICVNTAKTDPDRQRCVSEP